KRQPHRRVIDYDVSSLAQVGWPKNVTAITRGPDRLAARLSPVEPRHNALPAPLAAHHLPPLAHVTPAISRSPPRAYNRGVMERRSPFIILTSLRNIPAGTVLILLAALAALSSGCEALLLIPTLAAGSTVSGRVVDAL